MISRTALETDNNFQFLPLLASFAPRDIYPRPSPLIRSRYASEYRYQSSPFNSFPTLQPIVASYFVAEISVLHRPTYLSQTVVRHLILHVTSIRLLKKWTYGSRGIQLSILNRLFINFKLRIRECILETIVFQNSTEIDILPLAKSQSNDKPPQPLCLSSWPVVLAPAISQQDSYSL